MSNHVHALLDFSIQLENGKKLEDYVQLDAVMKRIKGASSHFINLALNKTGTVWDSESWDRYIRDLRHFCAARDYIRNNPVKAKLCNDWTEYLYTWIRPEP